SLRLLRPPPSTLFPYTTLFRSSRCCAGRVAVTRLLGRGSAVHCRAGASRSGSSHACDGGRVRNSPLARDTGSGGRTRTHLRRQRDRKSTRLNSSHVAISYAVFC